ncbi:helix-turn-helix transcriptional regulator [Pseudoflavonifractor phocaeensis]|uniref:helix-turn-helix transcriptional regulator n=1 Tax=Pseudoflavonifractor phocaeensis TaxID=1870988 RepID=UPI00313DED75
MSLGEQVQRRRLEMGMTQGQVARWLKAVDRRMDTPQVSRYEKGLCLPTREQLFALEEVLQASRFELYGRDELELAGGVPACDGRAEACRSDGGEEPEAETREQRRGRRFYRKCYRVSRAFEEALPGDLLAVCGYSSWQSWYDAALKRLVGEYGARKRALSVREGRKC